MRDWLEMRPAVEGLLREAYEDALLTVQATGDWDAMYKYAREQEEIIKAGGFEHLLLERAIDPNPGGFSVHFCQ